MTVSLKSGHFRVENRKAQSEIHGTNPIGLVPSGSARTGPRTGPDQDRENFRNTGLTRIRGESIENQDQ